MAALEKGLASSSGLSGLLLFLQAFDYFKPSPMLPLHSLTYGVSDAYMAPSDAWLHPMHREAESWTVTLFYSTDR